MTAGSSLRAVVVGGSAGSVRALGEILPQLPADFPPVLVVVHVLRAQPSMLAEVFASSCAMRVTEATAGEPIESGVVYFAPADYHLSVEPNLRCSLSLEAPYNFSRPSIDFLFESAAYAFGSGLAGVVLTGANSDGADGLRAVHEAGGRALVQEPSTSEARDMPLAAAAAVPAARTVPLSRLAAELMALRGSPS